MAHRYEYRKIHKRNPRRVFRRRLFLTSAALALVGLGVFLLTRDLQKNIAAKPTSTVVQSEVSESIQTFKSPYFEFADKGNWVYSERDSTPKEFVYYKYRGAMIEHRLTVHVNETPISLHLASTHVLPVKIINHNRLEADVVAGPCVQAYKKDDLRNIKEVAIQAATMLCDPQSPLFTVVLAEVNGSYNLGFRQSNGQPVKMVITYQDMRLDTDGLTVKQIAETFKVL